MFDYDAFNANFLAVNQDTIDTLSSFYHPDIHFIDPAHDLRGHDEIRKFWLGFSAEAKATLDHTARLGMPDPMQYGFMAFMKRDEQALAEQVPMLEMGLGDDHLYCLVSKARLLFLQENYHEAGRVLEPVQALAREKEFHYLLALVAQLGRRSDEFLDELEITLTLGELPAPQNAFLTGVWGERYTDVLAEGRYGAIMESAGLDAASIAAINVALGD